MDAFDRLKANYYRITRNKNFKIFMTYGAPMFVFCIGGSYVIEEFQKVRMDYINDRHNQELMNDILKQKGINKVDMREEYEKIKNADTSNYTNIRGPRAYEDNTEFLRNRELQEKRLAQILGREESTSTKSSGSPNTA